MTKQLLEIGVMIIGIIFSEFWAYDIYHAIIKTKKPNKVLFLMLFTFIMALIFCVAAILISFASIGAWRGI